MTFKAKSFQSRSHMITTNHNLTLFGLTSKRSVPHYLRHRVGGIYTYKSEGYFVEHISSMIQDDKGE